MLNGIETIFDNTTQMLRHLKKKSFEKNTQDFIDSYGHYFREMTEYVDSISDKERAAEEIADTLINRVEKKFASKKGKIDSRTQVDLNFFMIYYVFPTILGTEHEYAKLIADSICSAWGNGLKRVRFSIQIMIHCTDHSGKRFLVFFKKSFARAAW